MSYSNCFPGLPRWAWRIIAAVFVVGALTIIGGFAWGAYFLCSHLQWR